MNHDKFVEVCREVRKELPLSINEIREFVYADWREPEHEQWLESASVDEITDWVVAGMK